MSPIELSWTAKNNIPSKINKPTLNFKRCSIFLAFLPGEWWPSGYRSSAKQKDTLVLLFRIGEWVNAVTEWMMFLRFGQALPDIPFRLPQQCQRPIPLLAKVMKIFHCCLALPLAHLLCQFLIFFFLLQVALTVIKCALHTDLFYLVRGEKQALARESMYKCISLQRLQNF